jgi:hypothetical protein
MRRTRLVLLAGSWAALSLGLVAACKPPPETIGSARLPEADGTVAPPPEGAVIEVGKDKVPRSLSGTVRIVADAERPYSEVVAATQAVREAGGKPVLLVVTRRGKLAALPPPAERIEKAIKLSARAEGKACVSPPGTDEATCISRVDQKRIDRAFVRQILFKAVKEYELKHVNVVVDPSLPWSDAVRAIDGARTCCNAEDNIQVSVEPS